MLSGIALIGGYYQPITAQEQNMTGGAGSSGVTQGNATTSTTGSAIQGENVTTTGAARGNQSELILHLEEVRTALQNNDTESALMHLDIALNALGDSAGGTQGTEEEEYSECGAVTVGGTSAADDYGCPPDPDA